jgi:hypothetical protein
MKEKSDKLGFIGTRTTRGLPVCRKVLGSILSTAKTDIQKPQLKLQTGRKCLSNISDRGLHLEQKKSSYNHYKKANNPVKFF